MAASNTQKKRATDDGSSLSASTRQKSSPASSSGGNNLWTYEVFLSFRGKDTRHNFTDHLYTALNQKGIYTFRDDERLERGNEISSELLEAIERSKVSIIVLSKNYACCTWCLDELAKIVECMEAKDQTVLPVFYKVDPSDVKKERGDFKTAFDKHEQDFRDNPKKVKRWRSALKQVGSISGWHLHDRSEAKLITNIVDKIWERLNQIQSLPSVDRGLVRIDSCVEEIYELSRPGGICFVGIYGMGGIGKTTIARVVYERLSNRYEVSCFLANVREESGKKGLESLQETLLCRVLRVKDLNICDYYEGISLIRRRLCRKRILLVLDDVDELAQLERLAGREDWFGSGSRIIITTRDEQVLTSHRVNIRYKVKGLNYDEAHRLLYLKAFKSIRPTNDHFKLLKRIVLYANGLPLALEVLGSFLCDRNVDEWKSALERLEAISNQKIVKTLRISYDGLERMDKKIFLDIACFFKGKDLDQIMKLLDSCEFQPVIGIRVLLERSLITVEDNKLQMHDLVQQMGWEVVREQHLDEPGKWSRLWLCEDVYHVLARNMGTPIIEAMIPVKHKEDITHVNGKCFSTMSNLRLLNISNVHISEDFEYLSDELRILKWRGYPLTTLPSSFHPQKLFQLNLCYSRIEYLWNGIKPFKQLKTIKLSYSRNLVKTPDFTMIPNLERLDLQYCTSLLEVHQSVGILRRLVVLNLNKCENLVQFPSNVSGLKSLRVLNLHGCSKIDRLPLNLEEMEHLEELDVAGTAIRQVTSAIVELKNLRTLSLRGCGGTPKTWSSFLFSLLLPTRKTDCMGLLLPPLAGLSSLRKLDLSDCNLLKGAIPRDFGSLYSLEELNLGGNSFVSLPDSISQLSKLQWLWLEKCHGLQSLPKLPPGIISIGAEDCTSLKTISNLLEFTSPNIGINFLNCFNLVETRGSWNNNSLVIMLLKRWLQIINDLSNLNILHICLPGSEIPNLFNCQSEGSEVSLPDGCLDDEYIGFAVCAVFSLLDDDVHIMCCIRISVGVIEVCSSRPGFTTIKSDHLWCGYLSIRAPRVTARFFIPGGKESVVKRCGIRPLYKQDVEYLDDLSATDVEISMVPDLSFSRNLERSRIRKKIRKRYSCEDCDGDSESSSEDEGDTGTQHFGVDSHERRSLADEGNTGSEDSGIQDFDFGRHDCSLEDEGDTGSEYCDDYSESSLKDECDTGSEDSDANSRGTNSVADQSHDD